MKAYLPFILIALSVGIYFLYVSPAYTHIQELRAEKSHAELVLKTAKDIAVKRDAMLSEYNSIAVDNLNRLKVSVPEKFNSIGLLSYVNSITARYGMQLKDIMVTSSVSSAGAGVVDTQSSSASSPYKVSTVSFFVNGTYPQFVQLLHDIESSLYLFDVTSLTIGSGDTAKGAGVSASSYKIEFNTYSLN